MSNTRHTSDASKFRQERFASSPEFARGLVANLVAKRCSLLESQEDRELVWALQKFSHQPGGMKQVAAEIIAQFPEQLATPVMQKIGFNPGQIYSASQVELVREELGDKNFLRPAFPLKGETCFTLDTSELLDKSTSEWAIRRIQRQREADALPATYPAAEFLKICRSAAEVGLEKYLLTFCVIDKRSLDYELPWYLPNLISVLREYIAGKVAAHCQQTVVTSLGQQVHDALDYINETGEAALIEGTERLGKSHSVVDWCARHPGRARYVELVSSPDEISFFRSIAQAIGVSVSLGCKAQQLRQRIEETLQTGDLVLVIDEAHYLWPNHIDARTLPARIDWLRTALLNKGVPVALVTTPQFFLNQKEYEKRTRWTSGQLTGRLSHYQRLPSDLTAEDLEKVARAIAPGADARTIEALVTYAQASVKYLAGIRHVVDRAGFFARKDGRKTIQFSDVKRALKESVIPSDAAFSSAMQDAQKPARRRAAFVPARVSAEPLQTPSSRVESPLQAPDLLAARSDLRSASAELVH